MVGYTTNFHTKEEIEFHVGTPDLATKIRSAQFNPDTRVITLQLDGDELEAALWGLENYQKGTKVTITHDRDCPCALAFCHVHNVYPGLVKKGV